MSDDEDHLEFEEEEYDENEDENESEDFEDFDDEENLEMDEFGAIVENVFDEDETMTRITLKKNVPDSVKIGSDTAHALKTLRRAMLQAVPRVTADSFSLSYTSEEEKAALGVCIISNTKTSGSGSLYDPQMGPTRVGNPCVTCYTTIDKCPGHLGRIILPEPIFHPMAIENILLILKTVCHECGQLLISKEEFESKQFGNYHREERLSQIAKYTESTASSKTRCSYVHEGKVCNVVQRRYPKKPDKNVIQYESVTDEKRMNTLTAREVLMIFNEISDENAKMLGLDNMHPRNYIVRSILVPPNCVRPKIEDVNNESGQWVDKNDTEFKAILSNIQAYTTTRGGDKSSFMDKIFISYQKLLEGDKNTKGGKENVSMKARFKGKTGLLNNVSGKRGEQAARSVITGNDWIGFGMVGVPEYIRQKLTIPVTVAEFNMKFLQRLLREGDVLYIVRKNGKTSGRRLVVDNDIRKEYKLQIGDVVRRTIRNGDVVFFGRQPSLSVGSLIAMRVIIINDNTFQFALPHTKTFAADFDGKLSLLSTGSLKRVILPSFLVFIYLF